MPDPRRLISSGSSFESEIGYSRAVVDGEWVFVSGTTGFDYETMTIADDVVAQTEQCLRNIVHALQQAGASLSDVVRVTYIVPNPADFKPTWPVLRSVLRRHPPRRHDDLRRPRRPADENRDRSHSAAQPERLTARQGRGDQGLGTGGLGTGDREHTPRARETYRSAGRAGTASPRVERESRNPNRSNLRTRGSANQSNLRTPEPVEPCPP